MYNAEVKALIDNVEKVIVGKTEVVKLLVAGILTNGHILIDDVPGVGKNYAFIGVSQIDQRGF